MIEEKHHKLIYFSVVAFLTGSLLFSVYHSQVLPSKTIASPAELWKHFKALTFENWFWLLSVPGVIGLAFLNRKKDYVNFLIKMFYLIAIVMIVPVILGLWTALPRTLEIWQFLLIVVVVWLPLSAFGAVLMAQKEYVFGDYKRDTAWRDEPRQKQEDK